MLNNKPDLPRKLLSSFKILLSLQLGPIISCYSHEKTHNANGLEHNINFSFKNLRKLSKISWKNGESPLHMISYLQMKRSERMIHRHERMGDREKNHQRKTHIIPRMIQAQLQQTREWEIRGNK